MRAMQFVRKQRAVVCSCCGKSSRHDYVSGWSCGCARKRWLQSRKREGKKTPLTALLVRIVYKSNLQRSSGHALGRERKHR